MINFTGLKYRFRHESLAAKNDNFQLKFSAESKRYTLTPEKAQYLLRIIHEQNIDISSKEKIKIVVPKDLHKIQEIDSNIVLEISQIRPRSFIDSVIHLFRGIIGLVFGKQSSFTSETAEKFEVILKNLPYETISKIKYDLSSMTKDEKKFLRFIGTNIHFDNESTKVTHFLEILNGGYVVIDDNGKTYEEWANLFQSKQARISSHTSNATQYAVRGPLVNEFLFSKKTIVDDFGNERQVTWFQLERYPLTLPYALPHLLSWVIYKVTGENQGPYGSSSHTESRNPIVLRLS